MATLFTLRPYQQATLEAVASHVRRGLNRVLVKSPTGTGKTVTFAAMPTWPTIMHWLDSVHATGPARMLVIAHREELLDQSAEKIHRANPTLQIAVEQASRVAPVQADVIVASIQTLAARKFARLDRLLSGGRFRLVVVDEAHHAAAATYREALARLGFLPRSTASTVYNVDGASADEAARVSASLANWDAVAPKDQLLVGVTATPNRSDAVGLSCVFQALAYSYDLKDAIADQWLVPMTPWAIQTSTRLDDVGLNRGEFNQRELGETVNTPARNRLAVRAWVDYAYHRKTLAFTVDVQHAHDLAQAFRDQGISAAAISGETPKAERRQLLDEVRRGGGPMVLCNCMVLTEGTDLPNVSAILHAKPTRSATLYEQMTGRGLRLAPGKTDCVVIDLVDLSRKHSLQTAPVLYGLPPLLAAQGKRLDEAARAWEEALLAHPGFDPTLDGKGTLETLEELQARAELVDVWKVPDLGAFGRNRALTWVRVSNDVYRLQYPWGDDTQEVLIVEPDLVGKWQIRAQVFTRGQKTPPPARLMAAGLQSADAAANVAEDFVQQQRPTVYRMKASDASWRAKPASPKQLKLLRTLRVPTRPGLRSGEASDLIDLALSRRGGRR